MITVHLSGVTALARSKPVDETTPPFGEQIAPDTLAFQVPDGSKLSDVARILSDAGESSERQPDSREP